VLHRVSEWAKPTVVEILRSIRGSPDVNADETGWREDGINGYLWIISTGAQRFYYFHRRRASRIIRHILGGKFFGVLGCDFYKGYDWYLGPKQRCWAHLLRDVKKLVEKDGSADKWAQGVNDIHKAAKKASRRKVDDVTRVRMREALQRRLLELAEPYLNDKDAPQRVLCKRICQMSGGTRSAKGSQTKTRLMSVFATWALQGKKPIAACAQMIVAAQRQTAIAMQEVVLIKTEHLRIE